MSKVCIIIPTYNEHDNIERMIDSLFHNVKDANVLVVDDNSPDGTGQIADSLKKKYKNLDVIHRTSNKGLGFSIIDGIKHAKAPIVGVIDSDFSHPPEIIPEMIKMLDSGYGIALGSRYVKGGSIENWPFIRRITSKGAVMLSRLVTNVKDPVTGFFFMKKSVADNYFSKSINAKTWKIALDIIVKSKNAKIIEVPYIFKDRKQGKSKLYSKEYWHYILQVIELVKYRMSNQ